jgi:hypothetical protein
LSGFGIRVIMLVPWNKLWSAPSSNFWKNLSRIVVISSLNVPEKLQWNHPCL